MKSVDELLQPVFGYIELGMFSEAIEELENLPSESKNHPSSLLVRLDLLMEMHLWEEGMKFADDACRSNPEVADFWIKRAYCLHELKRTREARDVLLASSDVLRQQAVFHYNLACYEAQLGNLAESKRLLGQCFLLDKSYKQYSIEDPDLKPLWDSIENSRSE